MSTRRTNVPSIPEIADTPESVGQALRAMKEATEVGYGRRGDPLDRFVTLRDLRDGGVAKVEGGLVTAVTSTGGPGTGAPLPDDNGPPDYGDTDYTAPPKPRNVRARGMPPDTDHEADTATTLGIVMVTWDSPEYHNHYYAEVFRMPRDGQPEDSSGAPLFNIASNDFRPAYAHGVDRGDGEPNQFNGGDAVFVGVATGTIFLDRDLPPLPEESNELDAALNPGRYYYWVRFVSRAMVPGPVSDRAEARLSINPALVLDAMTRNVTTTSIFRHLREWLALGSPEATTGASILEYIDSQTSGDSINSIWSVRMIHEANGLVWTSGFGLGMDTTRSPDGDWTSLSTFLVNANQFAIMGPNALGGGARIVEWTGSGTTLTLGLASAQHGFTVSTPRQRAVLMIPSGDIRSGDPDEPVVTEIPSAYTQHAGTELEVVAVSGSTVTLTSAIDSRHPQNINPPSFGAGGAIPTEWGFALVPGSNIPFIVDTLRNVVGIRGSLIVDGLVRGTQGEFDELTANTAFIRTLQAEVVNANVVIGQRIIAGTPGSGSINLSDYNAISNYIVELNNPSLFGTPELGFPIRIWKPSTGDRIFSVSGVGDLFVGGHMTVGGSAVIAGEASAGSDVIFSTGGSGADTGPSSRYAMWIGAKDGYGSAGEARTEENGLFWVKSSGRAGFNTELFLGGDPFALPSGNGFITVKPRRNGGSARVFVSATFSIMGGDIGNSPNCCLGANLYLVPASYVGPGHGPVRPGTGYDPDEAGVSRHVGWFGTSQPNIAGGVRVAGTQIDSRAQSRDIKSSALQGSVVIPAGDYKVFVALWTKLNIGDSSPHGCFSIHPFAVQVNNDQPPESAQARSSDPELLFSDPAPIGPDYIEASEDILHGQFVNVFDDGGIAKVRLADASVPYRADGWFAVSAKAGDRLQIQRGGMNPYLEGLTPGEEYALSHTDPGGVVALSSATTTAGHIVQVLGTASSDMAMLVEIQEPTTRG